MENGSYDWNLGSGYLWTSYGELKKKKKTAPDAGELGNRRHGTNKNTLGGEKSKMWSSICFLNKVNIY